MDINYFLFNIRKYNIILDQIESINDELGDLNKNNINEMNIDNINENTEMYSIKDIYNDFIQLKKNILHLKNVCKKNIQKICKHDFVTDLIDINPDESRSITYCTICELTRL